MSIPRFIDHRAHAESLLNHVLNACDARQAVLNAWPDDLPGPSRCALIACGKASLEMADAAIHKCSGRVTRGVITAVPERLRRRSPNLKPPHDITVYEADHPAPTPRNVAAARAVAALARASMPTETLVVMLSGGGSAHLTLPANGLTLADLAELGKALMRAGASIREINTVRKHTEILKGGNLAAMCHAHRIAVFILSDVIGDPLDVIASGPFTPDPTTFADALAVLERYNLARKGSRITSYLLDGIAGIRKETPKPGDLLFGPRRPGDPPRVQTTIVASNRSAINAASEALRSLGFHVLNLLHDKEGDAASLARVLSSAALSARASSCQKPAAIIMGGEPTVDVRGSTGLGGPSQELALACAQAVQGTSDIAIVAFSTDGRDGPTDAAGAIITGETWREIERRGIDSAAALSNHASTTALSSVGSLLSTGATGTNLNHVAAAMIY